MKVIELKERDSSAENEFSLMCHEINHENILKYYEHFDHEINGKEYICIITEYCQACLIKLITFYSMKFLFSLLFNKER